MRILLAVLFSFFLALPALAADPWYEVDNLNAGLSAPPENLDRSTPQSTVEALLDAAARWEFDAAAHLLDLGTLDPADQARQGPALAEMLFSVIDRKVVIKWGDLLDRPDALDADASTDSATAGQVRRSIRLWLLDLDDRSVEVRLNRVKAGQEDPVWVFTSQTVENIPRLYARYGPTALERALPATLRGDAFWGLRWWEVIGLPLTLLATALVGFAVYRLLSALAARSRRRLFSDVLNAMRVPVIVALMTTCLAYATQSLFTFSGVIDTVISPVIVLGFVWASLHFVMNVIDAVLDRLVRMDDMDLAEIGHDHNRQIATRISAFRRALTVVIVLVGGWLVLSSAKVFDNLGFSFLASAGALTVMLGFAARNVLGNIMASMQIAMNQSARIGDKIVFQEKLCNVERIHFTFVQLREWTGTRLVVPVEEFVSNSFENWSMQEPELIRLITLKLHHLADVDRLRDEFEDIANALDQDGLGDPDNRKVAVTAHDVFGQEVTFCLPVANPNTAWDIECDVREKLVRSAQKMQAEGQKVFPDISPAEAA